MTRIALYAHQAFYLPIVRPVHDELLGKADCLLTRDRRAVVAFRPDVVVMASHTPLGYFRERIPWASFVNIRHGLISKLPAAARPVSRRSAYVFDAICVGHPSATEPFQRSGMEPAEFWWTGYPQMDALFRRDPAPKLPVNSAGKTVLYAPTWNLGLSSAPMLGTSLVDHVRAGIPDASIIIKPHPVIPERRPEWMAWWRRMAEDEGGVYLVNDLDSDVTRYMLAADLLISDASSVVFEYLALDRPVVLVTNPRHRWDPGYDADDIVWRWRDLGQEVHTADDLPRALADADAHPGKYAEVRRHYAKLLFGSMTDGCNHVRVAERVLAAGREVADGRPGRQEAGALHRKNPARWLWTGLRAGFATSTFLKRIRFGPLAAGQLWLREHVPGFCSQGNGPFVQ